MKLPPRRELKRIFSKGDAEAPLARYFTRHVSYPFSVLLLRTRITPNQITVFSTGVFIAGAVAQLDQSRRWVPIAGALTMWFGLVLDTVDGEIARYRRQYSVKGGYVDMVSHRLINTVLFYSAGVGLWLRDGSVTPLFLAMGASFGELGFTMMLYAKWRALLDHPKLLQGEIQRVVDTPNAVRKRLKAGFNELRERKNPLTWFYDTWFGLDYVGAVLFTTLVLSIVDRIDILLWIYGVFLPLRAILFFVRRCFEPFSPELDSADNPPGPLSTDRLPPPTPSRPDLRLGSGVSPKTHC